MENTCEACKPHAILTRFRRLVKRPVFAIGALLGNENITKTAASSMSTPMITFFFHLASMHTSGVNSFEGDDVNASRDCLSLWKSWQTAVYYKVNRQKPSSSRYTTIDVQVSLLFPPILSSLRLAPSTHRADDHNLLLTTFLYVLSYIVASERLENICTRALVLRIKNRDFEELLICSPSNANVLGSLLVGKWHASMCRLHIGMKGTVLSCS